MQRILKKKRCKLLSKKCDWATLQSLMLRVEQRGQPNWPGFLILIYISIASSAATWTWRIVPLKADPDQMTQRTGISGWTIQSWNCCAHKRDSCYACKILYKSNIENWFEFKVRITCEIGCWLFVRFFRWFLHEIIYKTIWNITGKKHIKSKKRFIMWFVHTNHASNYIRLNRLPDDKSFMNAYLILYLISTQNN